LCGTRSGGLRNLICELEGLRVQYKYTTAGLIFLFYLISSCGLSTPTFQQDTHKSGVVYLGKWHGVCARLLYLPFKINKYDGSAVTARRETRSCNIMLICSLAYVLLFATTFPFRRKLHQASAVCSVCALRGGKRCAV
jgi:hypothetical protein